MPHVNKQMLSFFLTTRCNLDCWYCYNHEERTEHGAKTVPFKFAKLGVDYFYENYTSRHIRFYGPGEPTQEFELMKRIRDYAQEKFGDKLTVEIQTNGAFNANVRDWLCKNVNIIWISMDGPPDVQDANRPFAGKKAPTSSVIEENIRKMLDANRPDSWVVGIRLTMSNETIDRQIEMIDYFYNLGIHYIWTNPLFPSVEKKPVILDDERQDEYQFDMDRYVEKYEEAYKYAKERGVFWGSFLTCNFDGKSGYNCRCCTPVPHLTPDGYISACDMASFGENAYHMAPFIYGKWDKENNKLLFDEDKIRALQSRSVKNIEGCDGCIAAENCGGYCLGEVTNETGTMFGKKPKNCEAIIRLFKSIGTSDEPYKFLHP